MTAFTRRRFVRTAGATVALGLAGCADGGEDGGQTAAEGGMTDAGMSPTEDGAMSSMDPMAAPTAEIDRFDEAAGTLMVRDEMGGLPGPDEPIDFDRAPFVTTGLGPAGGTIQYYNFDVQPREPAPIYAFVREGTDAPVEGQLNVVGTIPGDDGSNDFWQVHRVTVPPDYEANTVASAAALVDAGYDASPRTRS